MYLQWSNRQIDTIGLNFINFKHFFHSTGTKVMITTGKPLSSANKTEVVDVVNGESCADLADFTLAISGSVGANLHGTPVLCGGSYSDTGPYSKKCYRCRICSSFFLSPSFSCYQVVLKKSSNDTFFYPKIGIGWKDYHLNEICFHPDNDVFTLKSWRLESKRTTARGKRNHKFCAIDLKMVSGKNLPAWKKKENMQLESCL